PFAVETAALTGSGKLDLVVASEVAGAGIQAKVSVLLGNGDGTFQAAHSVVNTASGPIAFTLADFSGDGKLDLAVASNPPTAGIVSVYAGNGDGTFQAPVSYAVGGFAGPVTTGDFNGDGAADLAVGVSNGVPGTA